MTQPWNIRPPAKCCAVTARPFLDGELFYSVLIEEKAELVRVDYCAEAWESRSADPRLCHWRGEFKISATEPKVEPVQRHDAEGLLRRMIDENEPSTVHARYILALMLERKKILRPVETLQRPSGILLVYAHKESGETFLIDDPQLHLSQIASIQEAVAALLLPKAASSDHSPSSATPPPPEDAPQQTESLSSQEETQEPTSSPPA